MAAFDSSLESLSGGPLSGFNRTLAFSNGTLAGDIQRDAVATTRPLEDELEGLRGKFAADVADTSQERHRLRSGLSSTIASRFGRVEGGTQQSQFSGNLKQMLAKAKARRRISMRGEKAIANQQLKDRIGIVKSNLLRRGRSLETAGAGARIQFGLDANLQAARDRGNAAMSGAIGAAAGGLAAEFGPKLFSRDNADIDPVTSLGTASSDFQRMSPNTNFNKQFFDIDANNEMLS
jgi:hypothetical protein